MQSTQSEDLHVQIVHSGPTKCIHAPKSAGVDRLFTGGDDFLVRILPSLPLPGVEPHLIEDATEPVTSLDADSRFLVTASEDGSVRLYRHSPVDDQGNPTSPTVLQSLLRRESLPLRCVALERSIKNGKAPRVVVCSDELIVKIIDVEDPRRIQLLDGHNRGLRWASWSPVAPLLVTCSTDGTARVTDLSDVEPKFVKSIEGILPITRAESDEASCACWHPSGTYFVMPSKAHELVVISAANDSSAWSRTGTFYASAVGPVPPPSGSITALSFSPNGRYLASATTNGQVTVWDAESRQAIRHKTADALVGAISWHPTKDALAWTDNEGTLARWSDVVGPTRSSPFEEVTFDSSKAARGSRGQIDDIFAGTGLSDDEDDNVAPRSNYGDGDADELDDFVVDDESRSRRHGRAQSSSRSHPRGGHGMGAGRDGMMIAATRPQPAFQPTSTPMRGQRRYLAYNLLGSVVAVEQESHQTISFESFDTSSRRNFRFSDMNSISMAALAKQGILFAAKQLGEQSSSVFFKPFVAASNNLSSEWTFNLDQGEDVEAVGLGGSGLRTISEDGWEDQDVSRSGAGIAVVATSKGYLRFLSASGMQLYLWAIGQPVVTLAVGARTVLVIYRRTGLPSGGFQDLGYKVIDLANFDVIQDDILPVAKDAHIRWAGYNDQHQPAFYDTYGTLFVLDRAHRSRQGRWVPSLDTKRIRDSASADASEAAMRAASTLAYWPIALTSSKLMVLLLKGGRSHPEVDGTRHMIQELELAVPLIHREGGTGPLEEKSLRDSMLAMTARDVKNAGIEAGDDEPRLDAGTLEMSSDKALLQLIQLACKADKHGRALDAARALHSTRTLEAALKIAAFFHLSSLAERMVALKEGLEGRPERVEEESRRWCDPSVRGGPSYSNPALVEIMTRASDRNRDGGVSSANLRKRASAALGEEFLPPSRSASGVLRGHSSTSDRFDSLPSAPSSSSITAAYNGTTSRSPSTSRTPQPVEDYSMSLDDASSANSLGKENLYQRSAEKRKSPSEEISESARTLVLPNTKAAKSLNPFARTSSNVANTQRDKQMHKSTSFFERIEPYEKESVRAAGAGAGVGLAKQSLLTGFAFRKDQSEVNVNAPAASEAGREIFGETQYPDEQGDESLQLTLEKAARANANKRHPDLINGDALPETIMRNEDVGETIDSMDVESTLRDAPWEV
ncbi:related to sepB protein [Ustilago trichophora]|uniref:Related to sepB protein n=1 Tax=Ustilago trichophora TaxID=86804 RepID=A0A5C3EFX8_9BASI|nr:related to sepB protein [Ustilago trichophora]